MSFSRVELEAELKRLTALEDSLDSELALHLSAIAEGKSAAAPGALSSSGGPAHRTHNFESSIDMMHTANKLTQFAPCFEAMTEDSKKLTRQVDNCRVLSDRLSEMVRRLDLIQVRAQTALACTEDVLNLKECRVGIAAAIASDDLPLAVGYIKQMHAIEMPAALAEDLAEGMPAAEREVRGMVQLQFKQAIEGADIDGILKLCPLLQTVGLEEEARDMFINFMDSTIFIAVSADAADPIGTVTDESTAYAQAAANVFNTAYLLFQQYLHVVIQGMEKSLGDVHFIRRLHAKCEAEAGSILKRYMKFRNVKSIIQSIRPPDKSRSSAPPPPPGTALASPAEMHIILDEVAVLLQYCSSYSKYIKLLCDGAESRKRVGAAAHGAVTVFKGPTDFDRMVDELVNRYYLEGEHWLVRTAFASLQLNPAAASFANRNISEELDDYFFVLQQCSLRGVASSNIQTACSLVRFIADSIAVDLLKKMSSCLQVAVSKICPAIRDNVYRTLRSLPAKGGDPTGGGSWFSLSSSADSSGGRSNNNSEGTLSDDRSSSTSTESSLEVFNVVEVCVRHTERLKKAVTASVTEVFGQTGGPKSVEDMSRAEACILEFDSSKEYLNQALFLSFDKLLIFAQGIMKDIFTNILGNNSINWELEGSVFDAQVAVQVLPKPLLASLEILLLSSTGSLSDGNKAILLGLLAGGSAQIFEQFISEIKFSFSGALKMEECVRSIIGLFSHSISAASVRGKFSKLREIMQVLTSEANSSNSSSINSLSHLSESEYHHYVSQKKF